MEVITTTAQLADFCARLAGSRYVTLDTEFMRERTYWPQLCLIQLAGAKAAAVIDPLAPGISLQPLFDLLYQPEILKVVHAGRQDMEIFVKLTGQVPTPIFDTQVAAQVLGQGEAASYEQLAFHYANARIDKSSRFTDWSRRPLSDKQLVYALADVTHLCTVFEAIEAELAKRDRASWVADDMASLQHISAYVVDPATAWQRLKFNSDKPAFRHMVKALAAWREQQAQRKDLPRQRLMRDETLLELAHHPATTPTDLERIRGLSSGFANGEMGQSLLAAIATAVATPISDEPAPDRLPRRKSSTQATLELLRVLLKQVSDTHDVAPRLIASGEELELLALNDDPTQAVLQGWRGQVFGQLALRLKRGEIALALQGGRVVTLNLSAHKTSA